MKQKTRSRAHAMGLVVGISTSVLGVTMGAGCSSGGSRPGSGAPSTGGSAPGGDTSGNSGGQIGQSGAGSGGAPLGSGGTPNGPGGGPSFGAAASGGSSGSGSGGLDAGSSRGGFGAASSSGGQGVTDGGTPCCADAGCQPEAVQTCVCTTWNQAQCCSGTWDTFCQATAEEKCQAPHCMMPPPAGAADGGGLQGSCCATHATSGCSDPTIQSCVCGLLADCCTNGWDDVCVQLVAEDHCATGVRDCVCKTWQQSTCCDMEWTDECRIVAEQKCGAPATCP